jgi:hypothetical protein
MCLTTNTTRPSVAQEDIYCFKVLTTKRRSLFYTFVYILGKITPYTTLQWSGGYANEYSIWEGYHSYKNYKSAYDEWVPGRRIYLCKIPKGVLYFEGLQTATKKGYASSNIIVLHRQTIFHQCLRLISKKLKGILSSLRSLVNSR